MKISRKRLKEIVEEELISEAYYGGIPGEPETPAGYGGTVDRAKLQAQLKDDIEELVRLGKIKSEDLSIETVRANQEIPWDRYQAIDDEVLGDIIRDFQKQRKFYKEGRVITPGVANDLTTQMNNLAGALQKFDPSALQGQPASDLRAAWVALESSMGDVFGDGLENAAVPTRKPLEECGMTDEPMPMPGPPPEPNRVLEPVYDDDEGQMAKGQLLSLVNDANELTNILGGRTQLPNKIQAKVTKATDYISAVKNYLQYQQQAPQGLHEMKITKERLIKIIKEETKAYLSEQSGEEGGDGSRLIEVEWSEDAGAGGGEPPPSLIRLHQDAVSDYNEILATEGQRAADEAITEFLSEDTGWLIIGWEWK